MSGSLAGGDQAAAGEAVERPLHVAAANARGCFEFAAAGSYGPRCWIGDAGQVQSYPELGFAEAGCQRGQAQQGLCATSDKGYYVNLQREGMRTTTKNGPVPAELGPGLKGRN